MTTDTTTDGDVPMGNADGAMGRWSHLTMADLRPAGQPISRAFVRKACAVVVEHVARATLRRHAASPLTGTPGFWERIASTVLADLVARDIQGVPSPEDLDAIAAATAQAFASSPVTSSDVLWRSIVGTVVTEYVSPSGLGDPIPSAEAFHGRGGRSR